MNDAERAKHVNFVYAELLILQDLLERDAITHQEIRDCFAKHGASLGELRELDRLLEFMKESV